MRLKITEYIQVWERANRPLTVVGMCLWLDIVESTLWLYEKGTYDTPGNQFSKTIKKAKMYIEMTKWEGGLSGKYDKTFAMFDLKVNHKAMEQKEKEALKAAQKAARRAAGIGMTTPVQPEEKEEEADIFNMDLSGLTDDELRVGASFRDIIKKAVSKE